MTCLASPQVKTSVTEVFTEVQYLQEVEHEPAAERGRDDAGGGKVAEDNLSILVILFSQIEL